MAAYPSVAGGRPRFDAPDADGPGRGRSARSPSPPSSFPLRVKRTICVSLSAYIFVCVVAGPRGLADTRERLNQKSTALCFQKLRVSARCENEPRAAVQLAADHHVFATAPEWDTPCETHTQGCGKKSRDNQLFSWPVSPDHIQIRSGAFSAFFQDPATHPGGPSHTRRCRTASTGLACFPVRSRLTAG